MTKLLPLASAAVLVACGGAPPADQGQPPDSQHHEAAAQASAGQAGGAEHQHGHGYHHDFSDVERFAAIFDDPSRDEWQHPDEVMRLLQIQAGMTAADLGAGTGYFLPYLERAVAPDGRVLALDVEPAMVRHMEQRVQETGMRNVEVREVTADNPGLDPQSVDRVLVVDTWHHLDDREHYASLLHDGLRPAGQVLVVDFTAESPHGPPADARLTPEQVAAELDAGGFDATVLEEELPYQYVVRGLRRP